LKKTRIESSDREAGPAWTTNFCHAGAEVYYPSKGRRIAENARDANIVSSAAV
jgi:hypothetical protein